MRKKTQKKSTVLREGYRMGLEEAAGKIKVMLMKESPVFGPEEAEAAAGYTHFETLTDPSQIDGWISWKKFMKEAFPEPAGKKVYEATLNRLLSNLDGYDVDLDVRQEGKGVVGILFTSPFMMENDMDACIPVYIDLGNKWVWATNGDLELLTSTAQRKAVEKLYDYLERNGVRVKCTAEANAAMLTWISNQFNAAQTEFEDERTVRAVERTYRYLKTMTR